MKKWIMKENQRSFYVSLTTCFGVIMIILSISQGLIHYSLLQTKTEEPVFLVSGVVQEKLNRQTLARGGFFGDLGFGPIELQNSYTLKIKDQTYDLPNQLVDVVDPGDFTTVTLEDNKIKSIQIDWSTTMPLYR